MSKSILLPVSFIFLIVISCNKADQDPPEPSQLKVDKTNIELSGGTHSTDSFVIQSNAAWTISVSPASVNWLSFNLTSGVNNSKVVVGVRETNTTGSSRTASIIITSTSVSSVDPIVLPVTQSVFSLQDSAALLLGRWDLYKDSSTNTGSYYFMHGGTAYVPNPGVYFGTAVDHYLFQPNGKVYMYANQNGYTSAYQLYPNNKIVISEFMAHDTGRVVQLRPTEAIFEWSNTSPNGGRYYRRTYLKK